MKTLPLISIVFVFCNSIFAQGNIIPIYEARVGGLIGGVQNGKWVAAPQVAPGLKGGEEYFIAGWNGVEEGGITTATKPKTAEPCDDFYFMETELKFKYGIAIGSGAKWNIVPRIPKALNPKDPVYTRVVSTFLRSKKILAPKVQIKQIYRVDLEGDGVEEVLISATRYTAGEFTTSANKGDYSFVMLRKVVGGKVQNIMLDGEFYNTFKESNASNTYEFSGIADLNGDGKMEIIVYGFYYEGGSTWVYEMKGNKTNHVKELSVGCGI